MGRTKGSKNKKTLLKESGSLVGKDALALSTGKRGRGRPKKVLQDSELVIKKDNTLLTTLFGNSKEVKQKIRALRKIKKDLKPGSKERIDIGRQIKELKKSLAGLAVSDKGKEAIIKELKSLDPLFEQISMDLNKFTIEQLKKHLENLKAKKVILH
jgi:hypothetical protein